MIDMWMNSKNFKADPYVFINLPSKKVAQSLVQKKLKQSWKNGNLEYLKISKRLAKPICERTKQKICLCKKLAWVNLHYHHTSSTIAQYHFDHFTKTELAHILYQIYEIELAAKDNPDFGNYDKYSIPTKDNSDHDHVNWRDPFPGDLNEYEDTKDSIDISKESLLESDLEDTMGMETTYQSD